MKITKKQFCDYVKILKEAYEKEDKLADALKPFFDRSPIITMNESLFAGYERMLNILCDLPEDSDTFYWWLREDTKKEIRIHSKITEKNDVYNVETLDGLYHFIEREYPRPKETEENYNYGTYSPDCQITLDELFNMITGEDN